LERIGVSGAITLTDISDSQIRILMSYHFDKPSKVFDGYYIERHENGNLTIRPEAVFG